VRPFFVVKTMGDRSTAIDPETLLTHAPQLRALVRSLILDPAHAEDVMARRASLLHRERVAQLGKPELAA
jgi:hypothetical protein